MLFSKIKSKSLLTLFAASALLFVSCNDKETKTESTTQTPQEVTLEQKKQALQNVAPTQTQGSTNSSGNLAVNPPHGQPGHDCTIPVGAPLNGTGSSTIKAKPMNTNTTSPIQASGEGKINPPHGQPGHRCDIQVGAPL